METTGSDFLLSLTDDLPALRSDQALRFIVLVPHRDCLPALQTYRRSLFAAGLSGAFAFPAVAPLALLKRPLDTAELKNAAADIRKNLGGGKIAAVHRIECDGWDCAVKAQAPRFFGAGLDLPLPVFPPDAVLQIWEKPILAPALLAAGETAASAEHIGLDLCFRAAALANLALQPVQRMVNREDAIHYSFSWSMGPLFWLPRHNRQTRSPIP